jgi:hypothetical protein
MFHFCGYRKWRHLECEDFHSWRPHRRLRLSKASTAGHIWWRKGDRSPLGHYLPPASPCDWAGLHVKRASAICSTQHYKRRGILSAVITKSAMNKLCAQKWQHKLSASRTELTFKLHSFCQYLPMATRIQFPSHTGIRPPPAHSLPLALHGCLLPSCQGQGRNVEPSRGPCRCRRRQRCALGRCWWLGVCHLGQWRGGGEGHWRDAPHLLAAAAVTT